MSHRRLAATAAAVLGVSLMASAAPAQAASWQTLGTQEDARLQVCKAPTASGAWNIRLRVRNGNDTWVKGQAVVLESGRTTDRSWASGRVDGGDTSPVGTVRAGRGDRWELSHSLSDRASGGGGLVPVSDIGRC